MRLFHATYQGKEYYANEAAAGLIIMLHDLWEGGYSTEGIKYDGITPVVDGLRHKPEKVEVEL
jgi:hypothetical protein